MHFAQVANSGSDVRLLGLVAGQRACGRESAARQIPILREQSRRRHAEHPDKRLGIAIDGLVKERPRSSHVVRDEADVAEGLQDVGVSFDAQLFQDRRDAIHLPEARPGLGVLEFASHFAAR